MLSIVEKFFFAFNHFVNSIGRQVDFKLISLPDYFVVWFRYNYVFAKSIGHPLRKLVRI